MWTVKVIVEVYRGSNECVLISRLYVLSERGVSY